MEWKWKGLAIALIMAALSFAPLEIPEDQPICRLYGIIQLVGSVAGVLAAAFGGFTLATNNETSERNAAKALITGALIGLIIIWLAPVIISALVESGSLCGW